MKYYIGTNKGDASDGIYVVDVGPETLSEPKRLIAARNPTWIDLDPERKLLLVTETFSDAQRNGQLKSFTINDDGDLSLISVQPTGGGHPCYVRHNQTHAFVANYENGTVAAFTLAEDGMLGKAQTHQHQGQSILKRQAGPHAHQIVLSPDQAWGLSCDLGTDEIYIYKISAEGFTAHQNYKVAVPGSGPRHLVFHVGGKQVYVLHEISGAMDVLAWDSANGTLSHLRAVQLPGEQASDLRQCGRFLYAGLRSHNRIAIIDAYHEAEPQFIECLNVGGRPRGFAITDDGQGIIVGNERENQLELYARSVTSGLLGRRLAVVAMPSPVCVCSSSVGHRRAVYGDR